MHSPCWACVVLRTGAELSKTCMSPGKGYLSLKKDAAPHKLSMRTDGASGSWEPVWGGRGTGLHGDLERPLLPRLCVWAWTVDGGSGGWRQGGGVGEAGVDSGRLNLVGGSASQGAVGSGERPGREAPGQADRRTEPQGEEQGFEN